MTNHRRARFQIHSLATSAVGGARCGAPRGVPAAALAAALLAFSVGCNAAPPDAGESGASDGVRGLGGSPAPGEQAYVGATLVDGTGADPVEDAVLHVSDGRVACAGSREECPVPEDVEPVELEGRWIVPGLVDAHVHYGQTGWADGRPDGFDVTDDHPYEEVIARQWREAAVTHQSYLCSGVTAVFDVGGFPWTLALRDRGRREMRIPVDAVVNEATSSDLGSGLGDPSSGPGDPGSGPGDLSSGPGDRGSGSGGPGSGSDPRGSESEGEWMAPPHVAATGPLLTWVEPRLSLPAEQSMVQVEEPVEGREAVGYVDAFGADAAKVWFLGAPEERRAELDAVVEAMGEETRERGLPLAVHATSLREAEVAVEAGADVLVHSVSDEPVSDHFLEVAREEGTIYTPTLLVSANWGELANHAALEEEPELDDPLGCVDPGTRERIHSTAHYGDHPSAEGVDVEARRESARAGLELMSENLLRVHEAGIPVAAGTDAGNPLTVHGAAIHPELEAMQDAGIPPEEILVMATRNGARAMGRDDVLGTLESGKVADFLVVEADPLEDIAHLRELSHVARAGRLLPQDALSFR